MQRAYLAAHSGYMWQFLWYGIALGQLGMVPTVSALIIELLGDLYLISAGMRTNLPV